MNKPADLHSQVAMAKKKAKMWRLAIIATTAILVIVSVIVNVIKRHERIAESKRQAAIFNAEQEKRRQLEREYQKQQEEKARLWAIESQRLKDSIDALPKEEPEEPPYTWYDLEYMIRNLTKENYFALIWKANYDDPTDWVVIYHKKSKIWFRHFNPVNKTFGKETRLIEDGPGKYHVYGNQKNRFERDSADDLVHTINGVEKESFVGFQMIDLYTPEPAPDGYDSWEEYYDDNEEDLYFYYYGG